MLGLISSVLAGVSLYCALWVALRPMALHPFGAGAHSRHWLMHITWPWVLTIRPLCEPWLSWRARARLRDALRLAGLAPVWDAAHVLALQWSVFLLVFSALSFVVREWFFQAPVSAIFVVSLVGFIVSLWPRYWIRRLGLARQRQMLVELPFLLDITTLCVEAGLNLHGALKQAALHGPSGPLRDELQDTLADMRAGMPRLDALLALVERTSLPALASLVAALAQAEQTGSSLGPVLRAQSEQRRNERFLRAEEQALKAPVKMLFPLVVCIFPCTFLVIAFPIAYKILTSTY